MQSEAWEEVVWSVVYMGGGGMCKCVSVRACLCVLVFWAQPPADGAHPGVVVPTRWTGSPQPFGDQGQFHERQVFHRPGRRGAVWGWFEHATLTVHLISIIIIS